MFIRRVLPLLLTYLSLLGPLLSSCQHEEPQVQFRDDLNTCDGGGPVVKTAINVRGRVSVLDVDNPNLWVIVSEQGIIGNPNPIYDGPDIVIPCNLPDSLKKQDLKVAFSGELRQYQGAIKAWTSTLYNSQLTAVNTR